MFPIRSTKSEKMYPSILSRAPDIESEPYYCLPVSTQGVVAWSQPTSPQPTPSRGFTGLLSPTHNPSHRLTYPKKNDEGNLTRNMNVKKKVNYESLQCMVVKYHSCLVRRQCTAQPQKSRDKQMKSDV